MADTPSSTLADRMDGDYEPPILTEPKGGPVPDGGKPKDSTATPEAPTPTK
jgi:hypothetical protein